MLTQSQIRAGVVEVLAKELGVDESLSDHSRLDVDLGAESIDQLSIAFRLEQRFGIRVDPGDTSQNFPSTVGDVVTFVERKLESA